jgi:rubrerythrin
MTNEETIAMLAGSERGREMLLTHIATTESAAVLVLDDILRDLQDPRLIKMALRHRADEVRHAAMLSDRLDQLGIKADHSKMNSSLARLEALWATLQPSTPAEKYAVLQVIEEQDAPLFGVLADAMRPHDPATAAVFERMGKDERSHVRYCHVAARELKANPATLQRYRAINEASRKPIGFELPIEFYDHRRHFAMIQAWSSEQLDPTAFGSGLVVPGLACGFVDGVGSTSVAYFYGLKTNPHVPMVARGKAILRLATRILQAARDAGYTSGVTSTANSVVERFWVERLKFKRNGESVLTGAL